MPVDRALSLVRAELPYRDQSARALVYRLYEGALDLDGLLVVARREVVLDDEAAATLFVLGASHAVELRLGGRRYTELLACTAPPAGRVLDSFAPASGRRRYALGQHALDVVTHVEPGVDAPRAGWPWQTAERDGRAVVVGFAPDPRLPTGDLPLTAVWVDPRPTEPDALAVIHSVHCYPGEGRVVTTTTTLSQPTRGR